MTSILPQRGAVLVYHGTKMDFRIEIGKVLGFDELPPDSIALDGAVEGPRIDAETRRFSFDHHAGCLRLLTSATCRQVADAVLLGLDPTNCRVYLNDIDGDTLLACFILTHHDWWRKREDRERLRPLLDAVAALDAHGPAYPVPYPALSWHYHRYIVGPAIRAKFDGFPDGVDETFRRALDALDAWWEEELPCGKEGAADAPMPEIHEHGTFVVAVSQPPESGVKTAGAMRLYEMGLDRLVMAIPQADGSWRYTLAKRSDLVAGFPLPSIYAALNRREEGFRSVPLGPSDRFGGGSSIGGGPRRGSRLSPDQVAEVIEAVLAGG